MNSIRALLLLLLLLLLMLSPAMASNTTTPPAMATVPLEEILRLHNAQQVKHKTPAPPPAPFTVEKMHFNARLLDNAVEVDADYELSVLNDNWVQVALLHLDGQSQVMTLPQVDNGYFLVKDNRLLFLSREPGRYRFNLRFIKFAERTKQGFRQVILAKQGALATLQLRYDSGLFDIDRKNAVNQGDHLVFFAAQDRFSLRWKQTAVREPIPPAPAPEKLMQSVVTQAHASVVATLRGDYIIRLNCQLQFAGKKSIMFTVPERQQVQYVYLNGIPIPFNVNDHQLEIPVSAARAGDNNADVELVLSRQSPGYVLSGDIRLQLPSSSWRINQLHVSLHLPDVYNYQWSAGSLAPTDQNAAINYHHQLPTPGKAIPLQQQLVHGMPDVRLQYTVDLSNRYFDGSRVNVGGEQRDRRY